MQHPAPAVAEKVQRPGRLLDFCYAPALLIGVAVYGLAVILMPLVVAAAGHRPFRIGAVVAMQNLGLLSAPLWGMGMDRSGQHRSALLMGLLLITLGFVGLTLTTSLACLLGSTCTIGLGTAAATTATMVFVVGPRSPSEWSGRISALQLFSSLGTTAGFALAGLLAVHRATMAGAAATVIAAVLACATMPASARQTSPGLVAAVSAAGPRARSAGNRQSGFGLCPLLACWFLFVAGVSCFSSPYPLIMHRVFGIGVGLSASVVSFATLLGLPLYAGSALLIRRWGSLPVFAAGITCRLACLAGLGCLSLIDPAAHHAAVLVCAGAFQACWPILIVSASEQLFQSSSLGPGLSTGLLSSAGAMGSAAGALFGGSVADRLGYRFVSAAGAVLAALSLLLLLRAFRLAQTRKKAGL